MGETCLGGGSADAAEPKSGGSPFPDDSCIELLASSTALADAPNI
jgi:hypothetical protein